MLAAVTHTDSGLLDSGSWYTPLLDIEFTLCHGADSVRFLQGQLSCNLQKLSTEQSLRGALCNLKGRVITDLRLLADDNGILILTQHGMHEQLTGTLNKYRVFFKTALEPINEGLAAFGIGGTDLPGIAQLLDIPLPTLPDQCVALPGLRIVRLPQSRLGHVSHENHVGHVSHVGHVNHTSHLDHAGRFIFVFDTTLPSAQQLMQLITEKLTLLPESLWQLADIRDGQVHIRPEQSGLFTPQLLNYDINGVIDFKKGCYTGQEIVARMHYRAEAKRRLYHLRAESFAAFQQHISQINKDDILDHLLLADGSVESLLVLGVSDADKYPGVTDFNKLDNNSSES